MIPAEKGFQGADENHRPSPDLPGRKPFQSDIVLNGSRRNAKQSRGFANADGQFYTTGDIRVTYHCAYTRRYIFYIVHFRGEKPALKREDMNRQTLKPCQDGLWPRPQVRYYEELFTDRRTDIVRLPQYFFTYTLRNSYVSGAGPASDTRTPVSQAEAHSEHFSASDSCARLQLGELA
jgi:hypothetical protein